VICLSTLVPNRLKVGNRATRLGAGACFPEALVAAFVVVLTAQDIRKVIE
jgi:hypothetical protein